mgnify:CR=1 FL=1
MLVRLTKIMDKFDLDDFAQTKEPGFFQKLFKKANSALEVMFQKYDTLGSEVEKIQVELQRYEREIQDSNKQLGAMLNENFNYYNELEKYIVAGEMAIEELDNDLLPQFKAKAESGDQMDLTNYQELLNIKDRILRNEFSDEKLFELNSAILNINNDYLGLDDRTFGIIRAEITRMTSVFMSSVKYSKKFCSNRVSNIRFLSNKIYVLSLDIANNEKLSKIIATYLKLKFQREILGNHKKDKSVFFLCDEYQEVCNAQDGNFFSLSREYKCINVISMQSYSSLVNSLLDEHLADVIIQNFVNKIWFRNDDYFTIQRIISILGKEKILNKSKSYTENGKNTRYNIFANKLISYKSDFSESYSENEVMQEKYTYDFFTQKLNTFEAMCMLSDGYKINLYEKIKFKIWEDDSNE